MSTLTRHLSLLVAALSILHSSKKVLSQNCRDIETDCTFWASIGECEKNSIWMHPNCPVACGRCNPRASASSCTDKDRLCSFWAGLGECRTNAVWMTPNCRKSCNTCSSSSTPASSRPRPAPASSSSSSSSSTPSGCSTVVAREDHGNTSPRELSRNLLSMSMVIPSANNYNAMVMQWGQFISHDLAKTTHLNRGPCNNCRNHGNCINVPTIFNDASSLIYGSSPGDAARLRAGNSVFMRTQNINGAQFPPVASNGNFDTGDDRASLFVGLAAFHALLLREHNRIAGSLQRMNSRWSNDRIFEEARKIVGAYLQRITYEEYLPKVLGNEFGRLVGGYGGYSRSANPAVSNVFTAAAFRFGHGMLQDNYPFMNSAYRRIGGYQTTSATFNNGLLTGNGVSNVLRGFIGTQAKLPQRITTTITENTFGNTDLAALNIQRGRDHGVPAYGRWRNFCGLSSTDDVGSLSNALDGGRSAANDIARQYNGNVRNLDLYVAGLMEKPVVNGVVGPTYACIIGEQFRRTRSGDRLWYEAPGTFTSSQLSEIRRGATLAALLCSSGDNFGSVPRDAFLLSSTGVTGCGSIPRINLGAWRD